MSRQGVRGGTTATLDEAATVIDLHKRQASELIESAIWAALEAKGEFHADDLLQVDVPADALNAIGARVNAFVRRGYMVEIGRRKSANPASNGRKSNVYRITPAGRARVGVSAGVANPQGPPGNADTLNDASADPGTERSGSDMAPLPRPGDGSDPHSQPGTVPAVPDDLQLPLGDVPMQHAERASYEDWDVAA